MNEGDAVQVGRYVDGEMTRDEVMAFERRMEDEPALAAAVDEVMRGDAVLRSALPELSDVSQILERAEAAVRPSVPWRQLATAVVLVAVGFGSGLMTGRSTTPMPMGDAILQSASAAHELYAVEVVHPVEVTAGERDHLKGWLSNRLGSEVRIPDLTAKGLSLVGGRLLPFEQGAAAQFMYEDGQGTRVTLYLTPTADGANSSLRYGDTETLTMVHWQGGTWHYALVGPYDKDRMTEIAQSVQGALF